MKENSLNSVVTNYANIKTAIKRIAFITISAVILSSGFAFKEAIASSTSENESVFINKTNAIKRKPTKKLPKKSKKVKGRRCTKSIPPKCY